MGVGFRLRRRSVCLKRTAKLLFVFLCAFAPLREIDLHAKAQRRKENLNRRVAEAEQIFQQEF
jgi:hypothetical protein